MKNKKMVIECKKSGQVLKVTINDYSNCLLLQDSLKRIKGESKTLFECFWTLYYYKKSLLANNFFYSQAQDIVDQYVLTLTRRDRETATEDAFFIPLESPKPTKNYFDLLVDKISQDKKLLSLLQSDKSYRSFYRSGYFEAEKAKEFYKKNIDFFN